MSHILLNLRMLSSSSPRGPFTFTNIDLIVTVTEEEWFGVKVMKERDKKEMLVLIVYLIVDGRKK